ncbi:hypothetical protein CN593_05315 [Bacillus pseudomycoides]|uniref:hypothetical protein n=1 Tax=Bacillus pseudomycoides TaxID=64104 RepID=UPI000BF0C81A|nr:hypothetical protein [Bacillus pseudomycoides]PEK70438.1 hypothetical protein CN593_05315 [Bacillus pseudomycoides]
MMKWIKRSVLGLILVGMGISIIVLYSYTRVLHNASKEVFKNQTYSSIMNQEYAMLLEKDGKYTYVVMTDSEKALLDQANTKNKFKPYSSETGKISTTQAMTIKKDNILYHLVSKKEDKDIPFLVQYQEENGTLKTLKVDAYQDKLSQELGIPSFHFHQLKD